MKILWLASTLEDTTFLKDFYSFFEGEIDVFHLNFITYLNLKKHKGVHLLPKWGTACSNVEVPDITKSFNVLSNRLTHTEAKKAYQATSHKLAEYFDKHKDETVYLMIPSGRHVHHIAATNFAIKNNIKRLYINYSNFPGYTFFDPEGTDCLSSIYRDPSLLLNYRPKYLDINAVFAKFAKLKEEQKKIPQAASSNFKLKLKKLAFVVDSYLQRLTNTYGDRRIKFALDKNTQANIHIEYDKLPDSDFIFFPLQVSTDQQVLVNYNKGSIIAAIDEALELALAENTLLVVREHPAEGNPSLVRRHLISLKQQYPKQIFISNMLVPQLINLCSKVVTINSTVGLESRINGKDVVFLGNSFYEKATDELLAIYLDSYLITCDYHKPYQMTNDIANNIIKRLT
ncbi:hypothetical protein [Pseudoalteromonas gelatinilytica]|uniref:capsular polysaccharide export protein, LipB/KpsS family n=1 Tax=Pseudoalteromonas gelatinilytica TaxID=1703256 RepID=UPI0007C59F42|nr:hypothetical protein [Pseudoalteromonas gelatinilytica]